jgi:hypothetical protein
MEIITFFPYAETPRPYKTITAGQNHNLSLLMLFEYLRCSGEIMPKDSLGGVPTQ